MNNQAKIVLSAEDRTAAAFAAVGRNVDKLGFNLGTLKGLAGSALGALAVPVSAGAIVGLINEARNAIDEFNDLKDVTGASIGNISALDKIARETGAGFETVSTSLIKFNMVLKDADPEKGAGAVLKALNLDIEKLRSMDPAEALLQVARALDGFADGPEKGRAYLELFGKSARDIAPFVKDLAAQTKLVGTVSDEGADEVEKFNKEVFKIQAAAADASRALTVEMVTALNATIAKFREAEKEGGSYLEFLKDVVKYAALLANGPAGALIVGARSAMGGGAAVVNAQTGSRSVSGSIVDLTRESSAETARLLRGAPPKPALRLPKEDPKGGNGRNGSRSGGSSAAKDPYAEANRYLESLQKQLQATEALTAYEKLLADLRTGSLGKVTPAIEAQLKATAQQIDLDKELQSITKEFADLNEAAADKAKALAEEGRSVWESTRTPIEQLNIEIARLQELLDAGVISFDTFARASLDLEENFSGVPDAVEKADSAMEELGATFASAFEDAILSGGDLKDLLKGLEADILRIITRKLVTEPLANFVTGAIKGFGFEDGGVMTPGGPLPLKSYARGGIASSPQLALYGEGSMNEAYVPLPDGRRIPVNLQGAGGGKSMVNHMSFNFTVPASVDRRTQEQMASMAGAAVMRANRRLS